MTTNKSVCPVIELIFFFFFAFTDIHLQVVVSKNCTPKYLSVPSTFERLLTEGDCTDCLIGGSLSQNLWRRFLNFF